MTLEGWQLTNHLCDPHPKEAQEEFEDRQLRRYEQYQEQMKESSGYYDC